MRLIGHSSSQSLFYRTSILVAVVVTMLGGFAIINVLRGNNMDEHKTVVIHAIQPIEPYTDYDPQIFQTAEDVLILPGNPNLIPERNVHGAMVVIGHHLPPRSKEDFEVVENRIQNAKAFVKKMPFPVTEWYGVFTRSCPYTKSAETHQTLTERGVTWAHARIWHEFVYFDRDVINEHRSSKKAARSADGVYEIKDDGSMFKNSQRFSEDDIMVVFEDDADIAIHNFNQTLVKELSNLAADLVLLGFTKCIYLDAFPALTTHAYAFTRAGIRKWLHYYEPCGASVDLQFAIMTHQHHFNYRTANASSYMNSYIEGKPTLNIKCGETMGMLIQNKKTLGTLNGHGLSQIGGPDFVVKGN